MRSGGVVSGGEANQTPAHESSEHRQQNCGEDLISERSFTADDDRQNLSSPGSLKDVSK